MLWSILNLIESIQKCSDSSFVSSVLFSGLLQQYYRDTGYTSHTKRSWSRGRECNSFSSNINLVIERSVLLPIWYTTVHVYSVRSISAVSYISDSVLIFLVHCYNIQFISWLEPTPKYSKLKFCIPVASYRQVEKLRHITIAKYFIICFVDGTGMVGRIWFAWLKG